MPDGYAVKKAVRTKEVGAEIGWFIGRGPVEYTCAAFVAAKGTVLEQARSNRGHQWLEAKYKPLLQRALTGQK